MLKALLITGLLIFGPVSLASAESEPSESAASPLPNSPNSPEFLEMKQKAEETHPLLNHIGFSFAPQYYTLNSDGYSTAFISNGLGTPLGGAVGLELAVFSTAFETWQFGLVLGGVGFGISSGTNIGEYSQDYFGLSVGKSIPISLDLALILGCQFGFGDARLEVISSGGNGRTDEFSLFFQPKLSLVYRVGPILKLGLTGSYYQPAAQSVNYRGQNLALGMISLHGATVGVQVIFGFSE